MCRRNSCRENWCLLGHRVFQYLTTLYGPVAQLIERVVRNDEVVGLIPIRSTISVTNPGMRVVFDAKGEEAARKNRRNCLYRVKFAAPG